jgi:hypothetical protein
MNATEFACALFLPVTHYSLAQSLLLSSACALFLVFHVIKIVLYFVRLFSCNVHNFHEDVFFDKNNFRKMSSAAAVATDDNVYLFVPNLIGYGRIVFGLLACWYMQVDYVKTAIYYFFSAALDAVDGRIYFLSFFSHFSCQATLHAHLDSRLDSVPCLTWLPIE